MVYQRLTTKNVFERFDNSKQYTNTLTESFPEWQRIARNRPFENADPALPKTTDGTTASIVQKTPKRVVQQLPTGSVISDEENSWLDIIAEFVYYNKIIPHANEDYGLFEKSHLIIESGLTFGSGASFAPFVNHDGEFTPDMTIPYWGDLFVPKGKKSASSAPYVFLRSWWQPEDIEAVIASEKQLKKGAKDRGEDYESTWDVDALESIKESGSEKDEQGKTPTENERNVTTDAIELVTAFQKGVGAKFYTFHPGTKKIVRTKTNKDPRGKIPIDFFYGDIDGTNPLGRGIVDLIGGLQNLIDSDMQMYQFNRAYAMAPALQVYGNIPLPSVKMEPNRLIKMSDLNGKIVPLTVDTSSLENYPELYGLQKSQLLNLVNSPDTSISSEVGNPGFGKTPQALKNQNAVISVDDNAIRKRFESWFEAWSETAINLYFAERTGLEVLQLDKKSADRIRKLVEDGKYEPGPYAQALLDQNQVIINYDTATPALKFRVDASTSKTKDDQASLEAQLNLLDVINGSPLLQQIVPTEKIVGLYNGIVAGFGVEDPEKLTIDPDEFKKQQEEQEEAAKQQMSASDQQKSLPEILNMKFSDLPADVQSQVVAEVFGMQPQDLTPAAIESNVKMIQAQTDLAKARQDSVGMHPMDGSNESIPLVDRLTALGVPEAVLGQVREMQDEGHDDSEIEQALINAGEVSHA